jgi:phosphoserine aminotransferase
MGEHRIYNFSAGPSVLPLPVLERARSEFLDFAGTGMGVMEISHRSAEFEAVLDAAEQGIRRLLDVPEGYRVLFLQGGGSLQFSMVPMNFLPGNRFADYVQTGTWSEKAVSEARKFGEVKVIFSTAESGYRTAPFQNELEISPDAAYIHYCSNETIHGVEFPYDLDGDGIPVVCDASSNILSKPIDVSRYSLIYAGAQKNIGPSGVALVIIREDLLDRVPEGRPSLLDYRLIAENRSMVNTPNTWGIYIIGLVCDWLAEQGGVAGIARTNDRKAALLYEVIDGSDGFYEGHAAREFRSRMNVTFRLPSKELEARFLEGCLDRGFSGLPGHRSVGGVRASIYNAFPIEGVERLVGYMREFRRLN